MSFPEVWPAEKPDVEPADFGWFLPCAEALLGQYVGPQTKVIVELGSWLGKSTRWFLDAAPNATVFAIDHWRGSAEHSRFDQEFLDLLWPRFLQNCWDYRDRLIPIRENTKEGMAIVAAREIEADLVYVDASHDANDAFDDIATAMRLFPQALITGDDWMWGPGSHYPVRRAVELAAKRGSLHVEVIDNTWALHRRPAKVR